MNNKLNALKEIVNSIESDAFEPVLKLINLIREKRGKALIGFIQQTEAPQQNTFKGLLPGENQQEQQERIWNMDDGLKTIGSPVMQADNLAGKF